MKLMDKMDRKYLKPIPEYTKVLNGWEQINIIDNNEELVSLKNLSQKIIVSPQYFINNIKGSENDCLVRKSVAEKLIKIANKLPEGFNLLIWDAFRTIEVQNELFEKYYNEVMKNNKGLSENELLEETKKFVSLPSKNQKKPSPHNTGAAVDLTICNQSGEPLKMGSFFDEFGIKSYTRFYEKKLEEGEHLTEEETEILYNRRILCNLFSEENFLNYPYEIWHKSYKDQMCAKFLGQTNAEYGGIE